MSCASACATPPEKSKPSNSNDTVVDPSRQRAGVVPQPPIRIAQRLVRARDLLEARFRRVVTRIDVRVKFPRKPLVGALDLDQRRSARQCLSSSYKSMGVRCQRRSAAHPNPITSRPPPRRRSHPRPCRQPRMPTGRRHRRPGQRRLPPPLPARLRVLVEAFRRRVLRLVQRLHRRVDRGDIGARARLLQLLDRRLDRRAIAADSLSPESFTIRSAA